MLLLTGHNDHQAPLAELTVPLMRDYANRHKLGFRAVHFDARGKEAYWQKIILTLRAFDEGFDRVFWLDADQAITCPELHPIWIDSGFHASLDWGKDVQSDFDFSMCGYIAHVDTRAAFEWVNERHDEFINGDFPEQTPMRQYFREHPNQYACEDYFLNRVPDEVSPGNVVAPWKPTHFASHLTMLPIAERVTLFHKIMGRIQ